MPSTLYSEFAIHRLAKYHFAFPYRHLFFQGAGHTGMGFPYAPEPPDTDKRYPDLGIWEGGNAQADAHAKAVAWPVVLQYLGMMK